MFEESKETFTVTDKTFLIFDSKIRFVVFVHNHLCVKDIDILLKFVEMKFSQTIPLEPNCGPDHRATAFPR